MATIGDILDEFFSPFSSETLWVMPEDDNYTKIVRQWQPVIDAVGRIKSSAATICGTWSKSYVTDPKWKPTKTDNPKPGAHREFVKSPPGTDPATCKKAFVVYVTSKAASILPVLGGIPAIQTRDLYTCSIGSFNIYTTADQIDCTAKKATLSFWMYNNMSKKSFGKFASEPEFALCGMENQYMWWNWVETIDWSGGAVVTVPKVASQSWW
jgi:hypothetical protein